MSGQGSSRPRKIGRYSLLGRLASGGMATVHLGRLDGDQGFRRRVAIKQMSSAFAEQPQARYAFIDEARLASRVSHPNVVQTLDVVTEGHEIFVVLEYVHGQSLFELLREAARHQLTLPVGVVATIVIGALRGLHAAHEARDEQGEPLDLVHRDVSPQNILVEVNGMARVLDFGIAKARGRLQATQTGQLKGKLAYMAPEQIYGTTSRASDIFSMGIVLWESLTARRLFRAENEGALLAQVLKCDVPPPSSLADVPPDLEAVCLQALSFEASHRYSTAEAFAEAIERLNLAAPQAEVARWVKELAAERVSERERLIESLESKPSFSSRRRALPIAVAAALVVGLAALGVSQWVRVSAASYPPVSTAPAASGPRDQPGASSAQPAAPAVVLEALPRAPGPEAVEATLAAPESASKRVEVGANQVLRTKSAALETARAGAVATRAADVAHSEPDLSPAAANKTRIKARPVPAKAVSSSCDPPWVLNAAGDKVYKRECFK